jgi:uncharacterized protein with HXXEE motif
VDANLFAGTFLSHFSFRDSVWLFPLAFMLHIGEEWPRFTIWARKYASNLYSRHDYTTIHLAGIISAFVFAAIVWRFPNRTIVFLFFAVVFAPGLFFNSVFHAGATVLARAYCPGVITALTIYLPLFVFISRLAWRERLLDPATLTLAMVIAGIFHTWEVGHNVFKAW